MSSMFKRKKDKKKGKEESSAPVGAPPTPEEVTKSVSSDFSDAVATTEDEPGLLFTGERVNGRPVIKGGNIEKLVERLTYEKYNDTKYMKAFMLTFRSFTTPAELLQLLINRFNITAATGASPEELTAFESGVKKVVRLRVFNVLKHWLNQGFYDFKEDAQLRETLQSFIQNQMAVDMENPARSLQKIIETKLTIGEKEYEHVFTGEPPAPVLIQSITPANKMLIETYSPKELARQMTLIEYRLFAAINPSECVSQHWMSKRKEELAPNILRMISRFNDVSNWVASEIVKCTDLTQRTKILRFVIEMCEYCYELNNFNAVMEIISGLNSSSVHRLKATWGGLPKKVVQSYQDMHATMSRELSYKAFRAVLRSVNPPCIPYLGMYLTDLTFIEEGNQNKLPDGSINFTKRQRLSEVIAEIQTYQNTPYFLAEVSFIRDYLFNVEALPEEQCYKLSQKREGRRGQVAANSDLPDLPFGDLEVKSSYLFDKPDTDEVIKFDKKDSEFSSHPPVLAGTLVKLIERLTYHEYQDMNFLNAFLMTLWTFSSSTEVLELLDNRFNMPKPANPSKQQMDKFVSTRQIPIHLRICNLIKTWINNYPEDWQDNSELQEKFYNYMSEWAKVNPKIKITTTGVKTALEKKMAEPLPTPECRFLGFLHGEDETEELAEFYKGKGVLDFPEDLLAEQITLIEQNFFASIRGRECLCTNWSDYDEMERVAPNILAIRQNFDATRRWAISQVIEQTELQKQYSALTVLVTIADKLLTMKNFNSSMAITSGLQYLHETYPEIWEWIPLVIFDRYKELELLLKAPRELRKFDKGDAVPIIPFIDTNINQLNGIISLIPENAGKMIHFDRRKKQWDVYHTFEVYQGRPYSYEYDGTCGGYLYRAEILSMEEIEEKIAAITRPAPPDCRPELIDIQKNYEVNSLGDVNEMDLGVEETEGGAHDEKDEAAFAQIKTYMMDILSNEPDMFMDLITEAKSSLASELMGEVKSYTTSARDELTVMHSEMGIGKADQGAAARILSRVFKDSKVSNWEAEDVNGSVFGWKDTVNVHIVQDANGKERLAQVKSHFDKSYASVALRLFEFFEKEGKTRKRVIVAATATEEARKIMTDHKISVFNFVGTQLC